VRLPCPRSSGGIERRPPKAEPAFERLDNQDRPVPSWGPSRGTRAAVGTRLRSKNMKPRSSWTKPPRYERRGSKGPNPSRGYKSTVSSSSTIAWRFYLQGSGFESLEPPVRRCKHARAQVDQISPLLSESRGSESPSRTISIAHTHTNVRLLSGSIPGENLLVHQSVESSSILEPSSR